jgi:hypothetical protein
MKTLILIFSISLFICSWAWGKDWVVADSSPSSFLKALLWSYAMKKLIRFVLFFLGLFGMMSHAIGNETSFHTDNDIETVLEILLSNLEQDVPGEYEDTPVIWGRLPVDNPVVPKGSCYYQFQPESYNKIKYLLLPQLAGLARGENVITGQCFGEEKKECFIKIIHSFGESKSYFELRFKTIHDKIITDSLFCEITP